jgi:hypothetical protein
LLMMERSLGSCVAVSREAAVVAAVAAVEGRAVVDAEEEAVGALETVEMECSISAVRARPGGRCQLGCGRGKGAEGVVEAGHTLALRRMFPDLAHKLGDGAPVALDAGSIESLDVVGGLCSVGL